MIIQKVRVRDVLETNSYFYIDEKSKHGWLIDPGAEPDKLLDFIKEHNLVIEAILITHGHIDHIGAVEKVSRALHIPYKIHREGKTYLESTHFNMSQYCDRHTTLNEAEYLEDGEILSLSACPEAKLQVIHTPGHTTDSVIYYDQTNNLAFVGDTIFKSGIGNPTFPGGNEKTIIESIRNRIFTLPENTVLYSGHSDETTVGAEKQRGYL